MTKVLGISALAILLGITAANARHVTRHDHPQPASPYIDQTPVEVERVCHANAWLPINYHC
jgi:hypothetical protein